MNLSEKTISKWERGAGFSDVSLILPLCKCLEIDVNELMTGERLEDTQYRTKAEDNLLHLMDQTSPKVKCIICNISVILTIVIALGLCLLAGLVVEEVWIRIALIAASVLLIYADISVVLLVAVNTEVYECCHCRERFVPTIKAYILGPHTMRKRYLKCPHCQKKGWDRFYLD